MDELFMMEDQLHDDSPIPLHNPNVLSMQELALIRVAIDMCHSHNTLNLLRQFRFESTDHEENLEDWNSVLDLVKNEAMTLNLPPLLLEELKPLLVPIAAEILKWRNFMENFFYHNQSLANYIDLCDWNSEGTIDYGKTAQNIIKQGDLNMLTRFQLSCIFCLENEIQSTWGKLTDQEKILCNKMDSIDPLHRGVISYWLYSITGDLTAIFDSLVFVWVDIQASIYTYAFENAATTGNIVATKYFFPKLTYEERVKSLVKTADEVAQKLRHVITTRATGNPKKAYADILCYLLSNMTKEEQIKMFEKYTFKLLVCYTDWPRQRLLPSLLEHVWTVLDQLSYHSLLCIIVKKHNMSAYNYPKLFRDCFLKTPETLRESVLYLQCTNGTFLTYLFEDYDVESIRLVVRCALGYTKEDLFNSESGFDICLKLMLENKWHLLNIFIRECELSRNIKSQAVQSFKLFLASIYNKKQIKSKRFKITKFIHMLDKQTDETKQANLKSVSVIKKGSVIEKDL